MTEQLHLRLAGVTRLALDGRGPKDMFVFDPHRLAWPCWALALDGRDDAPATLFTFDRHFDLVAPMDPAGVPDRREGVLAIDHYARRALDIRNVDHILAAVEAGHVGDIVAIARSWPRGAEPRTSYTDRRGQTHRVQCAPTLEAFLDGGGRMPDGPVLVDLDLDCFTTQSDAEPRAVLSWPQGLIRDHLLPEGSEAFWADVLQRTVAVTLAREPYHCGGLLAQGRLLEVAAPVLFTEWLGASLP